MGLARRRCEQGLSHLPNAPKVPFLGKVSGGWGRTKAGLYQQWWDWHLEETCCQYGRMWDFMGMSTHCYMAMLLRCCALVLPKVQLEVLKHGAVLVVSAVHVTHRFNCCVVVVACW